MLIKAKLRPLRQEDSSQLLKWRNLPEISRWMYSDHFITREEHERWFAGALRARDRRYWVVEHQGRPVGLANLADISWIERKADWAFYLADASVRGTGLGAFVEFAVIEKAFNEMDLAELDCEVLEENAAVLRLHERFGFKRVGRLTARVIKAGRPADAIQFRLLADEWKALREPSRALLEARGFPV